MDICQILKYNCKNDVIDKFQSEFYLRDKTVLKFGSAGLKLLEEEF